MSLLRQHGFYVWYDYHFPEGIDGPWAGESTTSSLPSLIANAFGEDLFCDVPFVSGGAVDVSNVDLASIQQLPHLKELNLHRTTISDSQLEFLSNQNNLEKLHLAYTKISNDGLQHLTRLIHLRELFLNETKVTHEGVKILQQALPNCKIVE